MKLTTQPPTTSAQWVALIQKLLARELRVDAVQIDAGVPFTQYGLDSIAALSIAGDIEDISGLELPSTLLWDYQTVAELAGYLSQATVLAA